MARRVAISVLLIVALVPAPAAAAPVQGSLVVESGAAFPLGTEMDLTSAIVCSPRTAEPQSLTGTAARVRVRLYEQRLLTAAGYVDAPQGVTLSTWDLTGVTLSVAGGPTRFPTLAIEAAPGTAVAFHPSDAFNVTHRTETTLASVHRAQLAAPGPQHDYYERRVLGDHLYAKASGSVEVVGRGTLRVQDLDLVLDADQNRTVLWTGEKALDPARRVHRWAFLDFEDAALHLASPTAPLEAVGTASPRISWRGVARLVATDGMLVGPEVVYDGSGVVLLDGEFGATLHPTPGDSTMRLGDIRGDLRATTLEAYGQGTPAPAPALSPLLLAALLAGTVLASTGAAAGVVLYRERRRPAAAAPPSDPYQHWLDYADLLEREEDPAAVLACLRAAQAHAEEEEYDVVLWEATCHERLGDLEEALERYEAAIVLAPKGDAQAAFSAAMIAGQLGRSEGALTALRIALMSDPALLEALDDFEPDEDPFRDLRASPEFRRLRRDARGWARAMGDG